MAIISTEALTLAYDGKEVVSDLNIKIHKGDYLCIVGENGSGKSTLIKAIVGLIAPKNGKVVYGDGLVAKNIGYLPQQTQVQRDFPASVEEIVLSGCLNSGSGVFFYSKKQKQTATAAMDTLGISDIKKRCYNELSGGQQQRVLLARAMCATDSILVLDEPVAGLDPIITEELYETVNKLNKEKNITIVMVSHDAEAVEKYATHVLHIHDNHYIYDTIYNYKNSHIGNMYLGGEAK